jgi:hypothetical protein
MKKTYKHVVPICSLFAFGVFALLFSGCASSPAEKQTQADVPNSNARVVLHKDKDIQGVWLGDGFNFKGYDAIYVGDPVFKAVERPNEASMSSRWAGQLARPEPPISSSMSRWSTCGHSGRDKSPVSNLILITGRCWQSWAGEKWDNGGESFLIYPASSASNPNQSGVWRVSPKPRQSNSSISV